MVGHPEVSVVVPAFNASSTLAQTLTSAVEQTGLVVEIVCIDDGSSDTTYAIANAFGGRVKALTGPNKGVSSARNWGIEASTAPWLVFLDADDLLLPGTLCKRIELASSSQDDVIVCDWQDYEMSADGAWAPTQHQTLNMTEVSEDPELAFGMTTWATTAALMYRRELVRRIGGFRADLPVIQDARFAFDAARAGGRLRQSKHVGALYRVADASLSRGNPGRFYRDVMRNALQIEELWRQSSALTPERERAIASAFNAAGRAFFNERDAAYFDALDEQRRLGRLSMHSRIAGPLARTIGLDQASRLLAFANKQ